MIGGSDVVFRTADRCASLEACARVVRNHWRDARFEDAVSASKFATLESIPFGRVTELLAYRNGAAEASWDADSGDADVNSMVYLLAGDDEVTLVVDDPGTEEMRQLLDAVRDRLADHLQLQHLLFQGLRAA